MPLNLPNDLRCFGKTSKDYEIKRLALEKALVSCNDEHICMGLYEDLVTDCKDYEKLEKLYRSIALFLDNKGKDSFEYQQKTLQAKLLGFEERGISRVKIKASGCCESCGKFDGVVLETKKALLTLPVPYSGCSSTLASDYPWSSSTYEVADDKDTISRKLPFVTEFIPDTPRLNKRTPATRDTNQAKQADSTTEKYLGYALPILLLLTGFVLLAFSITSGVFLIVWSIPFLPQLWNYFGRFLPALQWNWNRYGLGLLGIFVAMLMLLVPVMLEQNRNGINETKLYAYELIKSEDRSNATRLQLQVHIYAPYALTTRARAQVVMQAAKQIQQTKLSEDPERPNYEYVNVILEVTPNPYGRSYPLAVAEYAPDGRGKQGEISDLPKNQWTWKVSSSPLSIDSQNPASIRSLKGTMGTYLIK